MARAGSVARPRERLYRRNRRRFGERVLHGDGIEIGALHSPFPVPAAARVRYVDRLTTEQLRAEYPELAGEALAEVDVLDDGETLATFPDGGLDFVIASHMLEHCEEPVGTLAAQLRVVRPGGVVLLALPDRRHGVDAARAPTSLEHLRADHAHGPGGSRAEHYRDWARLVDLPRRTITEAQVEARAADLQARAYRIHFHCWTAAEFATQLDELIADGVLPARVAQQRENYHEFLVALVRTG